MELTRSLSEDFSWYGQWERPTLASPDTVPDNQEETAKKETDVKSRTIETSESKKKWLSFWQSVHNLVGSRQESATTPHIPSSRIEGTHPTPWVAQPLHPNSTDVFPLTVLNWTISNESCIRN
jgi:hypothetical protein